MKVWIHYLTEVVIFDRYLKTINVGLNSMNMINWQIKSDYRVILNNSVKKGKMLIRKVWWNESMKLRIHKRKRKWNDNVSMQCELK